MDNKENKKLISIRVKDQNGDHSIEAERGRELFLVLRENGLAPLAPCGGKGKCGKCLIRLLEGELESLPDEGSFISPADREKGLRLACRSILTGDCHIELKRDHKQDYLILGDESLKEEAFEDDLAIAIDIGTTTLAFSLIAINKEISLASYSSINSQRSYGADVISRISAQRGGKASELKELIRRDIKEGIEELINLKDIKVSHIKAIAIAGNTTMLHLFMGHDTKGLGAYPFKPHTLDLEKMTFFELFKSPEHKEEKFRDIQNIPIYLLPGFSAFVGADILSGVYSLAISKKPEVSLFLDLGTNGEMVLACKDRLLISSAAAGPAFEGGNISMGTGSIRGAVSSLIIDREEAPAPLTVDGFKIRAKTIGDAPAVGICGSGVIETLAELVKNGIVDETGCMLESYFEEGFPIAVKADKSKVFFTQKDVRELQLAKAAIRTGLDLLIKKSGLDYADIDRLYIAGGFGYYMNIEKAALIGLIPKELTKRTLAVGNSSLKGAALFLREICKNGGFELERVQGELTELRQKAKEIILANEEDFNEIYMDNIMLAP
ncbi:MAG: ASKHA domain-containing protein [Lachnospiraceae bacterium]|nr:ASKHA domain-containing protein [Lachnospiraceae bacterium]